MLATERKPVRRFVPYCLNADVCRERPLRAPRANRVFGTDEKRIRTKNTVLDKSICCLGVAFIQDRRSARTGRRPRKVERHSTT